MLNNYEFEGIFNKVYNDLMEAYYEARKHKLGTIDEITFERNLAENIYHLTIEIVTKSYAPSPGIAFIVEKPVIREILAATFRDRVVHHYIYNHIAGWWDRRFINDSYSCRVGKGTDYGIRRLYAMMRRVSDNFHEKTIVYKFDLSGYFMSLPHEELYRTAVKGLGLQFKEKPPVYDILEYLLRQTIFCDPKENVKIRGPKELWAKLPQNKSLFCQPPGQGLPIGNLTSQLLSNIYMNQFDFWATNIMGRKNYGRYVDDFFFVVRWNEEGEFRRVMMPAIEEMIDGLKLKLHPHKMFSQEIWAGVPFLGAVLYPYRVLPSSRLIKNYYELVRKISAGEELNFEGLISYMSRCQHFDANKVQAKIFNSVGWEWQYDPNCNSLFYTNPKKYARKRKKWNLEGESRHAERRARRAMTIIEKLESSASVTELY